MLRFGCGALLLLALATLPSGVALASDGAIEINAVRAAVGGVTEFDTPGFPVTLSAPGSYLLTSDLPVGDPDTGAISITSIDVTVDLGGFTISGCSRLPCTGAGTGIISSRDGSIVRNGRIRGMGAEGIALQSRARVEDVDVTENGGGGIGAVQGSMRRVSATGNAGTGVALSAGLLEDSELSGNGGYGATLGTGASYARNVFSGNAVKSVVGGHATGGNVCSDKLCSITGARRFYLTPFPGKNGANALTACDPGFHMASMWEVHDPSGLFYDLARGQSGDDAGQGPPIAAGWIRNGNFSNAETPLGYGNCSAWTSAASTDLGGLVFLNNGWSEPTFTLPISPWFGYQASCDNEIGVWCVED